MTALAGIGLLAFAGCASTETRPTTPVYSGKERPDPTRPPRPDEPTPREDTSSDQKDGPEVLVGADGEVVPRHLKIQGEMDVLSRVAVILPFNSENAAARKQAQGLMDGIEAALFNAGIQDVVLLPKDTQGLPDKAAEVTQEALDEGADLILGPLFNHNISAVNAVATTQQVPVLSFGTDVQAAGDGAYLVSVPVEEEVARIVDWAVGQGVTQFALLGPRNDYGRRVQRALERESLWRGARMIDSQFYRPGDLAPTEQAQIIAATVRAADEFTPGEIAVLVPDRGNQLRAVAPLLQYYDVDVSSVKLLGTGLWNDEDVWREPTLAGGVFPAPDSRNLERYSAQHVRFYGEAPASRSSMGYDAALMALAMIASDTVSRASIERPDGFLGANGLFRFRSDGTPERGLTVQQVLSNGKVRTIDPAPRSFTPEG